MAKKTKKPKGLSISRKGQKFTFKWKRGEKYTSQKLEWRHSRMKKKKWNKVSIKAGATSYSLSLKTQSTSIAFRVKGAAAKKKTSAFSTSKSFKINKPEAPKVAAHWGGKDAEYSSRFHMEAKDKTHNPLIDYEWQSMLIGPNTPGKNNKSKNWNKASKSVGTRTSAGYTELFNDSQVALARHVRYFRCRTRGLGQDKGRCSDWVETSFVYADPKAPQNLNLKSVTYQPNPSRPRSMEVGLEFKQPDANPVDNITIEYLVGTPTMQMTPADGTWNPGRTINNTKDKDPKDKNKKANQSATDLQNAKIIIPQILTYDQCVWVKVVAHYKNTYSESEDVLFRYIENDNTRKSGLIGVLTPPTINKLQKNKNYTVTVNIVNSGAVSGAYCAITYINPKDTTGYNNQVIKVLESRDYGRDVSFQCPPWQDENDVSFNIYTFIPADGAIQFTNTLFDVDEVLRLSGEFVTGNDYGIAEYNDEYYFAMLSTSQKQSLTELYKYDEEEGEWGSKPVYESKNNGKDPHPPTSGSQYYNAWNAAWANKGTDTHGNPIVDNNLGDVSYVEVTPKGDENPSEEGWYEREFDEETQKYVYFETEDTTVDPLKTYYRERVINLYEFDAIMRSGKITEASPNYPTKVQAKAVEPDGTIQVTWKNDWEEASGIEVSWADHADALYSTNAPSTFEVLSAQQNKLNISGLEMGKTWYIWVRMYELEGESKLYGPYSDMQAVELVTAPVRPILTSSPSPANITENQTLTLSWVFVSKDNSNQEYAQIVECDSEDWDEDTGPAPKVLVSVGADQSIDINPKNPDVDWDVGTAHYLAVQVKSETGAPSKYSQPITVQVVEPPVAEIDRNLTTLTKTLNPINYSGSNITVDNETGNKDLNSLELQLPYKSDGYSSFSILHNEEEHKKECIFPDEPDLVFYGGKFDYLTGILSFEYDEEGSAIGEVKEIDLGSDNIFLDIGNNTFETSVGNILLVTADNPKDTWVLRDMPFNVKVNGAEDGGTTIVIIQRDEDYPMDRPDDSEAIGYKGETVFYRKFQGDNAITIFNTDEDLIGYFDDGAQYSLTGIVVDSFGQKAQDTVPFYVEWEHQPVQPSDDDVDISIEEETQAAYIKVNAPAEAHIDYIEVDNLLPTDNPETLELYELIGGNYILTEDTIVKSGKTYYQYFGDRVNIYRLSADKPLLLVSGAKFYDENNPKQTTYIDPYPTIGRWGGYRVVIITTNGDYITDDGPAWNDYDGSIDTKFQLINFDGNELPLKYNVSLDNSWNKSFTTTHYLGGSIEGDWMAGVERTGSLKGVNLDDYDPEGYDMFRELAEYTGVCNVRTIDGTNIKANVNVGDSSTFNQVGHPHDITLNLTRVDPTEEDGMTLAQWESAEE